MKSIRFSMFLALGCAFLLTIIPSRAAKAAPWSEAAPEDLPRLTVHWEDPECEEVFVVEGEHYRARVATHPARILTLEVDGNNVLNQDGVRPEFLDDEGRRWVPAPRSITPNWVVWRDREWRPAISSRARMNVWNAGAHYWDAHLLDIPFLPADLIESLRSTAKEKATQTWDFENDAEGWMRLQNIDEFQARDGALWMRYDSEDPYFGAPLLDVQGPVMVRMRVRSSVGGYVQVFFAGAGEDYDPGRVVEADQFLADDGQWRTLTAVVDSRKTVKHLRIDPPRGRGVFEVDKLELAPIRVEELDVSPARGEIAFHAHPDRLNIEFRVAPAKNAAKARTAQWMADVKNPAVVAAESRPVLDLGSGNAKASILATAGSSYMQDGSVWTSPLQGARPGAWWVVRPDSKGAKPDDLFADELHPVAPDQVTVHNGHWLGYDAPSGLYKMESVAHPSTAIGFNRPYDNPNRRVEIPIRIEAGNRARRMTIKSASNFGTLPATVLTDPTGKMLPTLVQTCKNFGSEHEEPDDSRYGDAYFPLRLDPGEEKSFRVVHLFQRWGDHMLKQISSIRFFHIYWHLSVGVSETTCFTIPWMSMNGRMVRIPDFRPYSGLFWVDQPQHSCLSWPGLLQYHSSDKLVGLMYKRTEFESVTPNMARWTMHFRTADDAASVAMTAMEAPQNDEMRNFLHLRYDWDKAVTIDGDARKAFRWFNVNDKVRRIGMPRKVVWTGPDGSTQTADIGDSESGDLLLSEPLTCDYPFLGSWGMSSGRISDEIYGSFVLVRSFKARLGGKDYSTPFASAHYSGANGDYWFSAPEETLEIQPGDFVEADLLLMPHGGRPEPGFKPERERVWYGSEAPKIAQVAIGEKIRDFPATVRADKEVARFRLTGGHNGLPVIVKGFDDYKTPLLWSDTLWRNQQCHGGDGWQVNRDQNGKYRFTFFVPIRHGMKPLLTVTRAEHTAAIARLRDANGYPVLEADADGTFSLKAPILFGPGRNTMTRNNPIVDFTGDGRMVRGLPILAEPSAERAIVDVLAWDESSGRIAIRGAAALHIGELADGAEYRIEIDEDVSTRVASGRPLSIKLEPGEHQIAWERK